MKSGPIRIISLACLLMAGCFNTTLLRTATPERQGNLQSILESLEELPERKDRPIMVGVSADGSELYAWDLIGGLLWRKPAESRSAPRIAGNYVGMIEPDGLVVRNLFTGAELGRVQEDVQLVGADGTAGRAVFVLALQDGEDTRGLVVALKDGSLAWELETADPAGPPALARDTVLLPWGTHRLSLVGVFSGTEHARIALRDSVAGHVHVADRTAYIGQHGILAVNRKLGAGSKEAADYYSPVARPMPGQPGLFPDAYAPVGGPDHASHRVRLDWRAARDKDRLGVQDSTLYLHFYRYVFALDAERDAIRWLYQGPADVVGTAVTRGGVYVMDAEGSLLFLNSMGHETWRVQTELRPSVVAFRPAGHVPQQKTKSAEGAGKDDYQLVALEEQLVRAAKLEDPRLAHGRAFAIEHLARFDTASVTTALLGMCDDPGAPDLVHMVACRHLVGRKVPRTELMAALGRHGSDRDGIQAPPVGPLASVAAALNLRVAAPLLVAHMDDPRTAARALPPLFDALGTLGNAKTAGAIERFVNMHHAELPDAELALAVDSALGALVSLRGKEVRPVLERVAHDGMSMADVAAAARRHLETLDRPKAEAKAPEPAAAPAVAAPTPKATDKRPAYLSMGIVAQVFRPVKQKLRKCLEAEGETLPTARISMIVHGSGKLEKVLATPASVQACMEPIVRSRSFPETQGMRQQVVHVVQSQKVHATRAKAERKARRQLRSDESRQPAANAGKDKPGRGKGQPATQPGASKAPQ